MEPGAWCHGGWGPPPSLGGHFGCFRSLWIVNRATENTGVQTSRGDTSCRVRGVCPEVQRLTGDSMCDVLGKDTVSHGDRHSPFPPPMPKDSSFFPSSPTRVVLFYYFSVFFLIPALTCVKRQNFYSKAKKTAGQSERACADQQPDHRQLAKCPPPRPGLRAAVPTGTVPEDTALQKQNR